MTSFLQENATPVAKLWELPDVSSRGIDRHALSKLTESKNSISTFLNYKSDSPTRHIALVSERVSSIGHEALYNALQPYKIRCIYPYVTAGVTIFSFYKLSDAKKSHATVDKEFKDTYQLFYIKPCLISKQMNERIFITVNYVDPFNTQKFNYPNLLSQMGDIHSLSECSVSPQFTLVNLEYDDERSTDKVLEKYHCLQIDENVCLQSFPTRNDQFKCTCHQTFGFNNTQMSVPIFFRDTSRTPPLPGYSDDPENHSFFSVDPFSKPIIGIKKKEIKSTASRTSLSSESTDTSYLSSSHLSFSSSEFCSNEKDNAWRCSPIKRESIDSSITFCSENQSLKNEQSNDASNESNHDKEEDTISEVSHHVTSEEMEELSSVHSTTSTIQMTSPSFVTVASQGTTCANEKATPSKEKKSSVSTKKSSHNENSFHHERIAAGLDQRSTFMIRNIPNKYTQQMLIDCINETHVNTYDFLYLRIDFKNKCNVGYAFINFINPKSALSFYNEHSGKKWKLFNSDKKCELAYANIQGKEALIKKFKNSQVMAEEDGYRPKLFFCSGAKKGQEQPFPKPDETNKYESGKGRRHNRR